MQPKKLNILITGGAGFIGTHLYNQLKHKHNITRIDNFKTSLIKEDVVNLDLGNLSDLDKSLLEDILKKTDIVYHFASSIGVDLIGKNPKETLRNSFDINNNMFPLFEKYNVRVIFSSTSEVYGSRQGVMQEDDDLIIGAPTQPRWGYATQKLMSEFLIKTYNFPYVIVRFFNIVGKNQLSNYGMVFPKFIENAKNNKDLIIYGNGENKRNFCDIRDAVNVLELLTTEMEGEILNIGSFNHYSIKYLAKTIIKLTNSKSNIVYEKERNSEIFDRNPDITKMKKIYTPIYNIDDIIYNMIRDNV